MTTYSMTPITTARLRKDHNTFAAAIDVNPSTSLVDSFSKSDILTGEELWTAPADGSEVKKGDKWLKVTRRNGIVLPVFGWVAYIHKGVAICNNFKEVETLPDPLPDPIFPGSFILTDPDGRKAEYQFYRIVE